MTPRAPSSKALASTCPCGTGLAYSKCCGPFHRRVADPPIAEALMRSRYSAFAKRNPDYLEHSWHPVTRPVSVRVRDGQRWTGLTVVRTVDGGPDDAHGTVEFEARYEIDGVPGAVREISEFARWAGRWVYVGVDAANQPQSGDVEPR